MINIRNNHFAGFTLVEMAIVLVILGFVLTALLLPLQAQRELVFQSQTQTTLENAKRALLGFAQQQGRLPCPATALNNIDVGSLGMENPLGGGACTQQVGFLPAATLGIQPTDAQGFALDAWNNRIRYAVTQVDNPTFGNLALSDFTTAGELATIGISTLLPAPPYPVNTLALAPNLRVCATSAAANCTAAINLTNNAVVVIYSTGATGAQGSVGKPDEIENLNAAGAPLTDTVFVSHDINASNGATEFDHLVVWISPFVLYNAMIEAGQLH